MIGRISDFLLFQDAVKGDSRWTVGETSDAIDSRESM